VKQKSQSSADFLGVPPVSKNVLDGCCIPTTTRAIFVSIRRHPEPEKTVAEVRRGKARPNQQSPLNPDLGRAGQLHEKSRSAGRCGFSKDRGRPVVDVLPAG